MKMLALAIVVIGLASLPALAADENPYGIEFVTTKFESKLTPQEIETVKAKILAAYPGALDRVVAYVGSEEVRKIFKRIYISIYDTNPDTDYHGISWAYSRPGDTQAIMLYGQPILTGRVDVQKLITHEMIHATFETRHDFAEQKDWPDYLAEGVAYFGAGEVHEMVLALINDVKPEFDVDEIMKDKDDLQFLRERTYVHCVEKRYGVPARKKLIDELFDGRYWKDAIKEATGEDVKAVQKKCDECLRDLLLDVISRSEPVRQVIRAWYNDDDPLAIQLAQRHLAENPNSDWRAATASHLARALFGNHDFDASFRTYNDIRTGKYGLSRLSQDSAYQAVAATARMGDCEGATQLREDFTRIYPVLWKKWSAVLDQLFDDWCSEAGRPFARGDLHYAKHRDAEAEEAFEQALAIHLKNNASHEKVSLALLRLGQTERRLKKYGEAAEHLRESYDLRRKNLPPESTGIFVALDDLAGTLADDGKVAEAEPLYREYIEFLKGSVRKDDRYIGRAHNSLGLLARKQKRYDDAVAFYDLALAAYRAALPPNRYWIATTNNNAGRALRDAGRCEEAVIRYEEALKIRREILAKMDPDLADTLHALARCEEKLGRPKEALAKAREALAIYQNYPEPDREPIAEAQELATRLETAPTH